MFSQLYVPVLTYSEWSVIDTCLFIKGSGAASFNVNFFMQRYQHRFISSLCMPSVTVRLPMMFNRLDDIRVCTADKQMLVFLNSHVIACHITLFDFSDIPHTVLLEDVASTQNSLCFCAVCKAAVIIAKTL